MLRPPRCTHLEIDFDADAEPIAGSVLGPDGQRVEFTGWMGLTALLGRILERSRTATDTQG